MFVLMRIDTSNYGWVVSLHRTFDAADAAFATKARKYPSNTAIHAMYAIHETTKKLKKGQRVRFDSLTWDNPQPWAKVFG